MSGGGGFKVTKIDEVEGRRVEKAGKNVYVHYGWSLRGEGQRMSQVFQTNSLVVLLDIT